uniref:Uncharacterized protein n=1 Tax=Aplanochytrium stocchinoi TaxID=215587 RepID=A0A6S8AQ17_9STRA|mmetsp:Transcript_8492/g.10735  ORF Transcript_8492/g.10735 Transcript_8492/m.10735 type:complete len:281 (-) Transcript_8492:914-1756(-)
MAFRWKGRVACQGVQKVSCQRISWPAARVYKSNFCSRPTDSKRIGLDRKHKERAWTLTSQWVDKWIVGEKLCPFAKPVRDRTDALRIRVSNANNLDELIYHFDEELSLIQDGLSLEQLPSMEVQAHRSRTNSKFPETILLVIDNGAFIYPEMDRKLKNPDSKTGYLEDFLEFNRVSYDLQSHLLKRDLVGHVQIVLFHPFGVHSMYTLESNLEPKAYAIRSPFPTFHILREKDIMKGVKGGLYASPELIPAKNSIHLSEIDELNSRKGGVHGAWEKSFLG